MRDEFGPVEHPVMAHVDLIVGYKMGKVFLKATTRTGTKFLEESAADIEGELLPMIVANRPLTKMTMDQILHEINERFIKWHDARSLPT